MLILMLLRILVLMPMLIVTLILMLILLLTPTLMYWPVGPAAHLSARRTGGFGLDLGRAWARHGPHLSFVVVVRVLRLFSFVLCCQCPCLTNQLPTNLILSLSELAFLLQN